MTQSTLFELTSPATLPLFDTCPARTGDLVHVARPIRQYQRERAHDAADDAFLERYTALLLSVGRVLGRFIAFEVTREYERRYGEIGERNLKGLGGLFARLQRQGIIEKTGEYLPRKNGCVQARYRLK